MRKLLVVLAMTGLWIASAKSGVKSYSVNIPANYTLGHTQLKPGDYQVKIEGQLAIFTTGRSKQVAEAPVTVTTASAKYDRNELLSRHEPDNSDRLTGLELRGTKLKLEFKAQP